MVRTAPMTKRCARPKPCQREMPMAMSMRPQAKPRSNHDTSMMARLAVVELWAKGNIGLFFGVEKSPQHRVGRAPKHVSGAPAGHDAPALQHNGLTAGTARFG